MSFRGVWRSGGGNEEGLLEKIIVAHYRHNRAEYDLEEGNTDRWINEGGNVEELGLGGFKSI